MQAEALIRGLPAQYLLTDKAYDTHALIDECNANASKPVRPPKRNRTQKRPYSTHIDKIRHLVENAFLKLKKWRAIATRYPQTAASFLSACHIKALFLWIS